MDRVLTVYGAVVVGVGVGVVAVGVIVGVGVGVVDGGVVAQPAIHATAITIIPKMSKFRFMLALLFKNGRTWQLHDI